LPSNIITLLLILIILFGISAITVVFILSRIKKCPSDKIMVIYGYTGSKQTAKCRHGGAAFIWPVIQGYQFLDLTPIQVDIDLEDGIALDKENVSLKFKANVAISAEQGVMQKAAERLLGLKPKEIASIAEDIMLAQLRLAVSKRDKEQIQGEPDAFLQTAREFIEEQIKNVGLTLISANITDVK
jgi:flotillin